MTGFFLLLSIFASLLNLYAWGIPVRTKLSAMEVKHRQYVMSSMADLKLTIMTGLADDWLADLNDLSDAQDEQEPFNPSYSLMYIACRAPLNSNNPRTQNG
ncbi:hypothetical protein CPB85DRAFT_1250049 [Mucidula mucida]|nr:hypothetical protein CPB85DRAFT_1250049 [Mucidula mucida]